MTFLCQLVFLTAASRAVLVLALDCGTWLTEDCHGHTDVRYDPSASTNLADLHPLYERLQGHWKGSYHSYDGNLEPEVLGFASLTTGIRQAGTPYNSMHVDVFWNISLSGSRFFQHDLYVYPPADAVFCDRPVPPGFTNVLGNGTCGSTGYASVGDVFRTSTHEKDAVSVNVLSTGSYRTPGHVESSAMPIGKQVMYQSALANNQFFSTQTIVFSNDFNSIQFTTQVYFFIMGRPITLAVQHSGSIIRVTEAEWIKAIGASYAEHNVPQDMRSNIPIDGCLAQPCPTAEHWCKTDPECSESPYKEEVIVKAGPVVGFAVAGMVLIVVCIVMFYQRRIQSIKKSAKKKLSKRMAESLKMSTEQLTSSELIQEFQSIDVGAADGSNGLISREELWTYVNSKDDSMTQKEFDVLFREVDKDRSGQIDFTEFCGFICELSKGRPVTAAVAEAETQGEADKPIEAEAETQVAEAETGAEAETQVSFV